MSWLFLALAGVAEIGWPVGLKLAQTPAGRWPGTALALACLGVSGWLLWKAQQHIPLGTAYAVWTGIGAAGTFVVGVLVFGDALTPLRALGVGLIVAGVVALKLAH
ncbi:multidrug efflux SMR transporter [Ideonella sp. TBM-1]|uniref:Guanidinium exporter n=1 Tax=Ideonella livida TaxID=2707176 RepID=A0A7C9TL34_9BURK|nr:multidrug efflux SMR transporter [Ideonella livida]